MLKKPCPTRAGVMADSRRCREPDVFAGTMLRWNVIFASDERIAKTNSASVGLAELMSRRGEIAIAFSSEVDTGSHKENASKQKNRAWF
jgi:hypothetical protein